MTYKELLEKARENMIYCKACPECNGLACSNTLPGPGSKGPGLGANVNWKAWQAVRLNVDTFVAESEIDTSTELFGRKLSMPLVTGPIGSMLQYSKDDVTTKFNDGVFKAAADCNILATYGDGLKPEILPAGLESMAKYSAPVMPVLNPRPNKYIIENLEMIEKTDAAAVSIVVDSAGLTHWKGVMDIYSMHPKTVDELKELKAHTTKPFVIKGIMTVKAARQAIEAGADAIIVSNHGGRVLPHTPSTVEVLPEIAAAVNGQTKIIVDGGIRSGADMLKAIALGADAALICRPFAVAWYGGGSEGVKLYIEKLRAEFYEAMLMCGARKLSDINRDMLRL